MFPFYENVFVPGKSPVKVQPKILDISLVELHIAHMDRGGGGGGGPVSLLVLNVTWIDLDPLAFILHFFKPVLDCK
jgi:hypothetical protein